MYPYNVENLNRFGRGDLAVQINSPGSTRPMGYCDGTEADLAELRAISEEEGVEELEIVRKRLKNGQEIWIVSGPREEEPWEGDD
jgi:hypothetical protein